MEPKMTPITPIKQVLVSFAGHEFLAVQLPGGEIAVVFRHFCEALQLNFWGQIERIQANPTLARNFLLVRITTPGGPQVVYALAISALSLWLGGFRLGRLSEEKRRIIIQLQDQAEAAFSQPFQVTETREQPKQSAPPKPEPGPAPLPVPDQATSSVPALLRGLANHIEHEQRVLERHQQEALAWQAETERRLQEVQAEIGAQRGAGKESTPAAATLISDEHIEVLSMLLYCAQRITGQPQQMWEQKLLAAAGVAEIGQIREADWLGMAVWVVRQLG